MPPATAPGAARGARYPPRPPPGAGWGGAAQRAPAAGSPPGRRPRPGAAVRQTMGAGSPAPAGLRRRLLTEQGYRLAK
ncbi:cAMP-binding protein 1-like isoform X2 [Phalacrocorax carbo]|uniref:cAMP-binding protein 1-like isoform X2 n=1 Tax=Phalacrocorax carbo TaxID=9209 RepID=UPI00311959FF